MRISDWSSDVCSSDLAQHPRPGHADDPQQARARLLPGHAAHVVGRPLPGLALLGHVEVEHTEFEAETAQEFAATGGFRGEMQHHGRIPCRPRPAPVRRAPTPFRLTDRKSTRLNSSHYCASRMPSSACKKKKHN